MKFNFQLSLINTLSFITILLFNDASVSGETVSEHSSGSNTVTLSPAGAVTVNTQTTSTSYWTGSSDITYSTVIVEKKCVEYEITSNTVYFVQTPIRNASTRISTYVENLPDFITSTYGTTTFTGTDGLETTETIYIISVPIVETTVWITTDFPDDFVLPLSPTTSRTSVTVTPTKGAAYVQHIEYANKPQKN
ncbi:hypothetical protein Kpol_221p4 [Vanderwaltozyma polyspora DSM 70294]|uniref:Uncharacterized protein n=1 Tax=Vanderwaltozyma polyspora (strain ATCC 22028 / DSM 70294 / BCRC 21397 / CBS 2163 / NBRC 10782 / NRRL Y-8283 / UCD 57-17) TaxID=436907 RepID=A7TTI4_VANPO|nr:uncharacterized protein Kpol_221p4 [Vanderwaltozyma polyspora DSM 70294]EDO14426.1 hypothetical protein Kpol_221p4 [Vanderwaltozyma polyspora DSM 70294]